MRHQARRRADSGVSGDRHGSRGNRLRRQPLTRRAWAWLAVIVVAVLTAVTIHWWENRPLEVPDGFSEDAVAVELVRVIDGDTIVVEADGTEERVRLLNIDTPETVSPHTPVECGGPEASEAIRGLLSPGDVVVLEFDQEQRDRYGRLLAGVFTTELFINEQMALQGWGEPVYFAPNDRYLEVIQQAWGLAEEAGDGLFSEGLGCRVGEPVG